MRKGDLMSIDECYGRVLSIQSHVVYGYVGNKAAVFPLQTLGFDVDIVNSVHFSNHTGYDGGFEGDILQGDQLRLILKGLERNHLLTETRHLLTGYIGSVSFLRSVIDVIKKLKEVTGGQVRYVCDPVMGDDSKFYVPKELVQVYRDEVIPLADVITPNSFEIEALTGIKIKVIDDALKACRCLHDKGPQMVIITSMELEDNKGQITILASHRLNNQEHQAWRIDSSLIQGRYTGTGDLSAALFLAWTAKCGNEDEVDLPQCLEKVVATMRQVIQTTFDSIPSTVMDSELIKAKELKIIKCKHAIENPDVKLRAYQIKG